MDPEVSKAGGSPTLISSSTTSSLWDWQTGSLKPTGHPRGNVLFSFLCLFLVPGKRTVWLFLLPLFLPSSVRLGLSLG